MIYLKKYTTFLLLVGIGLSLTSCNTNKITIDESEVNLNYETPELQIIAKDAKHKIDIDTTEIKSTESSTSSNNIKTTREIEEFSTKMQNEIGEKKNLTYDEKNSILKQINDFKVTNKETLEDLILLIDENISSFDQRERDLMIKKYILSLYDLMNNLNSILGVIGYDLETVVLEYNINVNDKTSIETIPNNYGTVKGFLLEVKDKGFFINSINENKDFYIDLDLANSLEKYRDYISPSMISYIEFNHYEMNNTLSLTSNNSYNLTEIVNRINMLSKGLELDKKNNYIMIDKYLSSLTYYYQLLLGLSHNQFIDTKTQKFDKSIFEEYKVLKEKNKNTTISDVLEKTILAIETNKMVYDDELKQMVNDYMNSLIYTEKITKNINTNLNSKYELLEKEQNIEEKKSSKNTETKKQNTENTESKKQNTKNDKSKK